MLIAQISDCHIAEPAAPGADRRGELRECVEYINRLDPAPDLVVHTGDIAHDAKLEEYAVAAEALKSLKPTLWVMPGNRDNRSALKAVFGDHIPENCHADYIQYSIDTPAGCLIMLDTVTSQSNAGFLCADRLSHLEGMLAAADGKPVTIFMHHPTFEITASRYPFQFSDQDSADAFKVIIGGHANIRSIHCGHTHRFATGHVAGVPATSIPSMASDLRQGPPAALSDIVALLHLT